MFRTSKRQQWKAIQVSIQKPKDKVGAYFLEKDVFCKYLILDFDVLKEQVPICLLFTDMSSFIMTREHKDEDELVVPRYNII